LLEGMALFEGQGKGGAVAWAKVFEHMGGTRTHNQCADRWSKTLKHRSRGGGGGNNKQGEWSEAEVSEWL
jgi:hypothetical protein